MSKGHRPCCANERIGIESLGGCIQDVYETRALGDRHIGPTEIEQKGFAQRRLGVHNDEKLCYGEVVEEAMQRGRQTT
ncbi:hypothetical protein Nepgr_006432 [Nepenthes gracilis]|uniref:Uncharacterized protein n=1 Tax=Nepenthes gracilis TaxID=150966 RepID=A0AAD3S5L9_NEPGR|nr:hypothetical protein Nepgr_006432 [Nepenthes gracilis]